MHTTTQPVAHPERARLEYYLRVTLERASDGRGISLDYLLRSFGKGVCPCSSEVLGVDLSVALAPFLILHPLYRGYFGLSRVVNWSGSKGVQAYWTSEENGSGITSQGEIHLRDDGSCTAAPTLVSSRQSDAQSEPSLITYGYIPTEDQCTATRFYTPPTPSLPYLHNHLSNSQASSPFGTNPSVLSHLVEAPKDLWLPGFSIRFFTVRVSGLSSPSQITLDPFSLSPKTLARA